MDTVSSSQKLSASSPASAPKFSPAQIVAFAGAASVTAAATGIAAYLYLQRRAMSTPQNILNRCRTAIDHLEKSIESGHA